MSPEIGAALIVVAAGVLGFLSKRFWWDPRDARKKEAADKAREDAESAADEALSRRGTLTTLRAACLESLGAFDDRGDARAAELVAHEQVTRACDDGRVAEPNLREVASRLREADRRRDRQGLESVLRELDQQLA